MPLNLSDNGQTMDQMLCILRADAASFLDQLRFWIFQPDPRTPVLWDLCKWSNASLLSLAVCPKKERTIHPIYAKRQERMGNAANRLPHYAQIYKFIITELPKTLCLCTLIFVFFKKTTNFLSHNKKFIHS